jgi:hypothetical protein
MGLANGEGDPVDGRVEVEAVVAVQQ